MRTARKGVPNEADFATTTFHSAFAKPQSGKREGIFSFEIVPEAFRGVQNIMTMKTS